MSKKPFPSQTQDRFIVRLPDGLRDRIAAAAKTNGRSMNSEIVATLEDAYPVHEAETALIAELEQIFARAKGTRSKPDAVDLYEAFRKYVDATGGDVDLCSIMKKLDPSKIS